MSDNIEYNDSIEIILKENGEECESLSLLHRFSYEKYNYKSNIINIPIIILSSVIGFVSGVSVDYDKMNIILGIASVFVGIIKSIDSYFQLSARASSHRLGSLQFSQINKKIAIELALPRQQRINAKDLLNIIKTDIKNLNEIMPLIDYDIIAKYNNKYKEENVKRPNIVNGLSEIRIIQVGGDKHPPTTPSLKQGNQGFPSDTVGGDKHPHTTPSLKERSSPDEAIEM